MKKKFNRGSILTLQSYINGKDLLGYKKVKFSYTIHKIRQVLDKEVEAISSAMKFDEDLIEYLQVNEDMTYEKMKENINKSDINQDIKDRIISKINENIELLRGDVQLDVPLLTLENMPDDLSENDFRNLTPFLEEEEENKKEEESLV